MFSKTSGYHGSERSGFTGTNPAKYPKFLSSVQAELYEAKLPIEFSEEIRKIERRDFRSNSGNEKEVVIESVDDLTPDDILDGLEVGDFRLLPKGQREFKAAVRAQQVQIKQGFGIIVGHLEHGSIAELLSRKFKDKFDSYGFYRALNLSQRAETLSVLLSLAFVYAGILKSTVLMSTQKLVAEIAKVRADFCEVTKTDIKSIDESDEAFSVRKLRSSVLFDWLVGITTIQCRGLEKLVIENFIDQKIRQNVESIYTVDLKALDILLEAQLNAANLNDTKPTAKPVVNSLDGTAKLSKKKRKLLEIYAASLHTGDVDSSKAAGFRKKKRQFAKNENNFDKCSYCGGRGHGEDWCFHNPARTNKEQKPLPDGFVIKPKVTVDSLELVHGVKIIHDTRDIDTTEISSLVQSGIPLILSIDVTPLPIIILDGGATHTVFNRFHRHLFLSFTSTDACEVLGIGGPTGMFVMGRGVVSFMGQIIEAEYCPNLKKSVVSEPLLCLKYGFYVNKTGNRCIIGQLAKASRLEIFLSGESYQYNLNIENFDTTVAVYSEIMLASVRPSDPKTLWHSRFGHSHMKGIVSMAKQSLYADRGLKMPEHLLKLDHDEDLCEACARGKPTIVHTYTPVSRSEVKGQMWYFDVSGGGDVQPSLVYGNRYLYLFVDSCTRKYFCYFTKTKCDVTTQRVLNQHYEEVIIFVRGENDSTSIIYFQSDNGELDTINTKAWMMRKRAIQRFTNPYTPSMNGMPERAFRSITGLALSMMMSAGLPPPYWEMASRHACLILDIQPNRTKTGWAREAYFLWTGLMFDYNMLRVFGSRCYALNHVGVKDFGDKSVEGISVGLKASLVTRDHSIFLPAKNKFITTGDAIFCEHVGRAEPERLLPPIMRIPDVDTPLASSDYQYLVGSVHFDNDEGVQYKVLKVYVSKGLVVVDRERFDPDDPHLVRKKLDTVHLRDILSYPILQGDINPDFEVTSPVSRSKSDATIEPSSSKTKKRKLSQVEWRQRKDAVAKSQRVAAEKTRAAKSTRRSERLARVTADSLESDIAWQDSIAHMIVEWSLDVDVPLILVVDELVVDDTAMSSNPVQPLSTKEPKNHDQAMRSADKDMWVLSELREKSSLEANEFAIIVDIPPGRKILSCMWVYTFKRDDKGQVIVYKSRVVVRGDQAVEGVDYVLTFSPVAKLETIRLATALIILLKMKPLQVDVNTAFVQSLLDEDIYMWGIPGYPLPGGKCYKLIRSLYGLPQSGRNWNMLFVGFIISMGFKQMREDLCLFILVIDGKIVALIALYVDDLLIGTDTDEREVWLIAMLKSRFDIKVIGLPSLLLGISMKWEPIPGERYFKSVCLSIPKCINAILAFLKMEDCRSERIPADPSATLSKDQCLSVVEREKLSSRAMQKSYRTIVGTFIWLSTTVRIDIIHIVLILCSYMANPGYEHYDAAIYVLRYLKGSIDRGLTYSIDSDHNLLGYVDSDHGSCEDRYPVYSWLFTFMGGPISWKCGYTKKITLSTAESEVRAIDSLKEVLKHLLYLKKMFCQLGLSDAYTNIVKSCMLPIILKEDNKAAIRYVINPSSHSSMKHLEMDIYWIHDAIHIDKSIEVEYIETKEQLADNGTKRLIFSIFKYIIDILMPYHK